MQPNPTTRYLVHRSALFEPSSWSRAWQVIGAAVLVVLAAIATVLGGPAISGPVSGPVAGAAVVHPTAALGPGVSGLWGVDLTGDVYAYGSAGYHGNASVTGYASGIVATPDGGGYWIISTTGASYALGDAPYYGNITSADPVINMAGANGIRGYWAVSTTGGVFAYGSAGYYGSLPGSGISDANVVALVPTEDGKGYWIVDKAGVVHAYGDAPTLSIPASVTAGGNVTDAVAATGGSCSITTCIGDYGMHVLTANGKVSYVSTITSYTDTTGQAGSIALAAAQTGNGVWVAPSGMTGTILGGGGTGSGAPPSYSYGGTAQMARMTTNNIVFPTNPQTGDPGGYLARAAITSVVCSAHCLTSDTTHLNTQGGETVTITGTGFQIGSGAMSVVNGDYGGTALVTGLTVVNSTTMTGTLAAINVGAGFDFVAQNPAGTTFFSDGTGPFNVCLPPGTWSFSPGGGSIYGTVATISPATGACGSGASITDSSATLALSNNGGTSYGVNMPAVGAPVTKTYTLHTAGGTGSGTANFVYNANGYWMAAADGGIFAFGVPFEGSAGGIMLNKPIVAIASTPGHPGYWMVARDGGIFSYPNTPDSPAQYYGSMGGTPLNQPIVGIAATADGKGYWEVARDGGIFNFGDAGFYGSAGNITLNKPIVGMAPTADGKGYWLVASDGGVFAYGDAQFYGSMGGTPLNQPIVGMSQSAGGKGYWMVAADGGIFAFGDAPFYGSAGNLTLNKPIVGMASSPDGKGYVLVATDGGVFNYGDAGFAGSAGNLNLVRPIVGIATINLGHS
jgi:hypothetical protein